MLILLVFAGCQPQLKNGSSGSQESTEKIEDLRKRYRTLADQKDDLLEREYQVRSIDGKFERLRDEKINLEKEFNELDQYAKALEYLDNELTELSLSWKTATRDSLLGLELPDFQLDGQEVVAGATLEDIDDHSITVNLTTGKREIPWESLPVEIQQKLAYKPNLKPN